MFKTNNLLVFYYVKSIFIQAHVINHSRKINM